VSKQRELWIKAMNGHVELFHKRPPKGTGNYIHVIEKSAYDKAIEALRECLLIKEETPGQTCLRYWDAVKKTLKELGEL